MLVGIVHRRNLPDLERGAAVIEVPPFLQGHVKRLLMVSHNHNVDFGIVCPSCVKHISKIYELVTSQ